MATFTANEERKKRLPTELPEALPTRKEGLRTFKAKGNTRKRAMTLVRNSPRRRKKGQKRRTKKEERSRPRRQYYHDSVW